MAPSRTPRAWNALHGTKTLSFRWTSDGSQSWLIGDWAYEQPLAYHPKGTAGLQDLDYASDDLVQHRKTQTVVHYDLVSGTTRRCDTVVMFQVTPTGEVSHTDAYRSERLGTMESTMFWSFVWRILDPTVDPRHYTVVREGTLEGTTLALAGSAGLVSASASSFAASHDEDLAASAAAEMAHCDAESVD